MLNIFFCNDLCFFVNFLKGKESALTPSMLTQLKKQHLNWDGSRQRRAAAPLIITLAVNTRYRS